MKSPAGAPSSSDQDEPTISSSHILPKCVSHQAVLEKRTFNVVSNNDITVNHQASSLYSPALEYLADEEEDYVDECREEMHDVVQLHHEYDAGDDDVLFQGRRRPTLRETWREVHRQSHMGAPIAAINIMWFARFMVSAAFLGQLGGLHLAGATLALTFANVAGWSVLVGLAGGMEAVCSQAHGAGRREVLEITLRRGVAVLLAASVPVAGAWCKAERLLLLMGQSPALAKAAQQYLLYLLPDLLATSLLAPLRIFLRSQCINKPLLLCSIVAISLHVPVNYLLVVKLEMGAPGTALAICITDFALALMLLLYVVRYSLQPACCRPRAAVDCSAMSSWRHLLRLAVPCCLMTCMESWCYEIMVLLTGLLPQSKEAVETVAIVLNGDTLLCALQVALASCVCTRVGNELGAKRPVRAYHATVAALSLSTAVGCGGAAWLLSSRFTWGNFFTKDARVIQSVAQLLPVMALMEMGNFPQTVACGVLRGSARPTMGALINLAAFYVLGIPLAILLGFKYKMGLLGLWIGLATAVAITAAATTAVVLRTDWTTQTLRAQQLTSQHDLHDLQSSTAPHDGFTSSSIQIKDANAEAEIESVDIHKPREEVLFTGMKANEAKLDCGEPLNLDAEKEEEEEKQAPSTILLREEEEEHQAPKILNERMSVQDQFADGHWKLVNASSGRQALGKGTYHSASNKYTNSDGRCWEVSMSMMNESMRKCAMMARLENDDHSAFKASSPPTDPHSQHIKRLVFRKLRFFASKKHQHKKMLSHERRRTN